MPMEAELAWLVATTWNVPLEFCGAVYRPVLSIVPPTLSCTLQVTAVLVVPVTAAVKDCVVPGDKVMELGVTVTLMSEAGGGGGKVGGAEEVEPPPHPQTPITTAITSARAPGCNPWTVNDPGRLSVRKYCMLHLRSRIDGLARIRRHCREVV